MQTNVETIINSIVDNNKYRDICRSYSSTQEEADELYQEFILAIYDFKNKNKLIEIFDNGDLLYYCCGIIRNMTISSTSPYHNKIRKFSSITYNIDSFIKLEDKEPDEHYSDYKSDYNEYLDKIATEYTKIDNWLEDRIKSDLRFFYYKTLFEMYYIDNLTYRDIEKVTQIKHVSVFKAVQKVINLIKLDPDIRLNNIK